MKFVSSLLIALNLLIVVQAPCSARSPLLRNRKAIELRNAEGQVASRSYELRPTDTETSNESGARKRVPM